MRLPPPTTWIVRTSRPARRPAFATAAANAAARLSRMQRTIAAGSSGGGVPGALDERRDPRGHVAGRQQRGVVGVDDRAARGQRRRPRRAAEPSATAIAGALPGPDRLLEQPQPHHVAQEADPSVDAHLVREVGEPARVGPDRRVELEADEAPGAAGDVRGPVVRQRHADDRRRGVVRPDVRDEDVAARARSRPRRRRAAARASCPAARAGRTATPAARAPRRGRRPRRGAPGRTARWWTRSSPPASSAPVSQYADEVRDHRHPRGARRAATRSRRRSAGTAC